MAMVNFELVFRTKRVRGTPPQDGPAGVRGLCEGRIQDPVQGVLTPRVTVLDANSPTRTDGLPSKVTGL